MKMSNPDVKKLANELYHGAVVAGLSIGYAQLSKTVLKSPLPKLEFNVRDAFMFVADVAFATATKEFLISQGIIPMNILN